MPSLELPDGAANGNQSVSFPPGVVPTAPTSAKPPAKADKVTIVEPPKGKAPSVIPSQQAWKEDAIQVTPPDNGSRRSVESAAGISPQYSSQRVSVTLNAEQATKLATTVRKNNLRKGIKETEWYKSRAASRLRNVLHGKYWGFVMTVFLFFALFLPDLWVITSGSRNEVIDGILFIVMVLFFVELILLSAVDATYFLSFFFFMDIIGTVTMIFDISFMYGQDHSKVRDYTAGGGSGATGTAMLLRATRAARVGARAGRLSRVLRMLRFLPFLKSSKEEEKDKGGIAGAISGQLANLLATRVACLTILLVIVIPLFDILTFPGSDYSLRTWVDRLARLQNDSTRDPASREAVLSTALVEMRTFFSKYDYGPYKACVGHYDAELGLQCTKEYASWGPSLKPPERAASAWAVSSGNFVVAFNMHATSKTEGYIAIVTICFIMFVMIFSSLVLSSVVTELAVKPLERMLQTVKDIAATVFKFAAEQEEVEEEETYDIDSSSEMKLLEKVVQKLAIIADLQSGGGAMVEATEDMDEEDIGILNMMQGKDVVAEKTKAIGRRSVMPGMTGAPIAKRKGLVQKVTYSDFGMTGDIYDSWNYNILDLTTPHRINLAMFTISRFHDPGDGFVNSELEAATLNKFIARVEKEYLPNPFHNFSHAVDVLHTVGRMMRIINSENFLVELEQYALLIAACAHDLGHPGVNNGFLSEVGHELALQYNDKSPLENMHCAKLYCIVAIAECNVFKNLTRDQYKEARKYCIETILHTDMMGHNGMVKDLQLLYQMNSDMFSAEKTNNGIAVLEVLNQPASKALAMNNFLHSADVSNPCRTWECCQPWAMMVLEEFFAQGDQEKMLGVPVQFLNDRDKLNRPNSQIGFLEFMIVPFFAAQIKLWPSMKDLGTNLAGNTQKWSEMWIAETSPSEEDTKKVQNRVQKVFDVLDEAKHSRDQSNNVCK